MAEWSRYVTASNRFAMAINRGVEVSTLSITSVKVEREGLRRAGSITAAQTDLMFRDFSSDFEFSNLSFSAFPDDDVTMANRANAIDRKQYAQESRTPLPSFRC
mmetsp:Transcript_30427/g.44187  ORF Transcript_30427/g.44187 Transcript_30427/m.44187 type:complete len:104 (-) Transcript_30427:335-646(-)